MRNDLYTWEQPEIGNNFSIDLPGRYARCIVSASFYDENGALLEAEFLFDVGPVE